MFHTAASDMTLTTAATQWIKSVQWDQENKVKSWGGSSNSRVSASNTLNIGTLHWDSLPSGRMNVQVQVPMANLALTFSKEKSSKSTLTKVK